MMLYFLQYLSDLFASYSYVVANKFYKINFYSTTEIFAYCNIYVLAIMLFLSPFLKRKYNFNLLNIKEYIKNKKIIYATFLSVSSSYLKTVLLSNIFKISQLELKSYAILSPFITIILCHLFLKGQKINKYIMLSFITCLLGFAIFNLHFLYTFSIVMIFYTFLNGYSDYKLKEVSKNRGLEMMFFDNLMFFLLSFIIFIIAIFNQNFTSTIFGIQKFNIDKIFNINNILPLLAVALLSFMAHNFKMISFKAKHIVGIITVGIFCKTLNSVLMTYIQYHTFPALNQVAGLLLMCIGLAIFTYKNYVKREII